MQILHCKVYDFAKIISGYKFETLKRLHFLTEMPLDDDRLLLPSIFATICRPKKCCFQRRANGLHGRFPSWTLGHSPRTGAHHTVHRFGRRKSLLALNADCSHIVNVCVLGEKFSPSLAQQPTVSDVFG